MTLLFWQVGNQINEFVLTHKRAEYGKQIVVSLSRQLVERYGKNFEQRNLRRMLQFAEQFTDATIVSTLSTQLSWSHFVALLIWTPTHFTTRRPPSITTGYLR